jgi:hypothetical protein
MWPAHASRWVAADAGALVSSVVDYRRCIVSLFCRQIRVANALRIWSEEPDSYERRSLSSLNASRASLNSLRLAAMKKASSDYDNLNHKGD